MRIDFKPWARRESGEGTVEHQTAAAMLVRMQGESKASWVPKAAISNLNEIASALNGLATLSQNIKGTDDLDVPKVCHTKPWRHQLEAYAYVRRMWAAGEGAMLEYGMGTGKTLVAILAMMNTPGCAPALIVCPKSVVQNWVREIGKHGVPGALAPLPLDKYSVAKRADIAQQHIRKYAGSQTVPVIIVNYDVVWREDFQPALKNVGAIVLDECVPPDTLIMTPHGEVPIATLKVGDAVLGYSHEEKRMSWTNVKHVFSRNTNSPLYRVGPVVSTGYHPIWTGSKYMDAHDLTRVDGFDSMQYTESRKGWCCYEEKKVPGKVQKVWTRLPWRQKGSNVLQQIMQFFGLLGQCGKKGCAVNENEGNNSNRKVPGRSKKVSIFREKPIQGSCSSTEISSCAPGERVCNVEWRERNRFNHPPKVAFNQTWVADRSCSAYASNKRRHSVRTISKPLQDRYSEQGSNDCDRGRWDVPRSGGSETQRQKEGLCVESSWVDGSEIYQLSSDEADRLCGRAGNEGRVVCNIETGTGNYFANRMLVHNCHKAKSHNGQTARFLGRFAPKCRYRLAMTGTPMPHSPLDIFAQYRAICPGVFGTRFSVFRSRYAMMGGFQGKQVVGYQNEAELRQKYLTHALQCDRSVLDLPDALHITRSVTLGKETSRIYREMEKTFVADVGAGVVTAANAMVSLLRLAQITGGCVPVENGDSLRVGREKQEDLEELLDGLALTEPVVVFCRFRADIDAVHDAARNTERGSAELSGRVNELAAWQSGSVPVLAVQIQAGGVGIDLTRACYVVYWSVGYSLGDYEQSLARAHRPGQTRAVTFYHLVADGTIDEKIYAALEKKKDIVDSILGDLTTATNE